MRLCWSLPPSCPFTYHNMQCTCVHTHTRIHAYRHVLTHAPAHTTSVHARALHRPTFLVAMQMGIEPIVMDEITSSLAAAYTVPPLITLTVAPYGARGFIGVSFTDEAITAEASASSNPAHDISAVAKVQVVLLKLRSAIDVLLFHAIFDLPPPRTTNVAEQIYQHIVRLPGDPVPPLGNASVTGFRVTTSRCTCVSYI